VTDGKDASSSSGTIAGLQVTRCGRGHQAQRTQSAMAQATGCHTQPEGLERQFGRRPHKPSGQVPPPLGPARWAAPAGVNGLEGWKQAMCVWKLPPRIRSEECLGAPSSRVPNSPAFASSSAGLLDPALTSWASRSALSARRPLQRGRLHPATNLGPTECAVAASGFPIPSGDGARPAAPGMRQAETHPGSATCLACKAWQRTLAALVLKLDAQAATGPGPGPRKPNSLVSCLAAVPVRLRHADALMRSSPGTQHAALLSSTASRAHPAA